MLSAAGSWEGPSSCTKSSLRGRWGGCLNPAPGACAFFFARACAAAPKRSDAPAQAPFALFLFLLCCTQDFDPGLGAVPQGSPTGVTYCEATTTTTPSIFYYVYEMPFGTPEVVKSGTIDRFGGKIWLEERMREGKRSTAKLAAKARQSPEVKRKGARQKSIGDCSHSKRLRSNPLFGAESRLQKRRLR